MQNFLSSTNYTFTISFTPALIIELLSSLQSFHIILQTLSHSTSSFQTVFQTLYKHLPFFTEAYKLNDSSPLSSLYQPIYIVIAIYFVLHLCLLGFTFLCVYFQKYKSPKKLQRTLNLTYLLHSRVLFFPIQFFLLGLLDLGSTKGTSQIYSHGGFKIVVILLSVLNFGLALIKEFLLKSIPQSKNASGIKTHAYHQTMLIHKALALLLYYLSLRRLTLAMRLSSVLHLLHGVLSVYTLYRKLPFYNFQLLKLAVITSSLKLSLSIVCILQVCVSGLEVINGLQILFLLLPVLIIKASLSLFQRLFTQILQGGNIKSPEYIIHYALLLKNFAFDDQNKAFLDQSFYPTRSAFIGALSGVQDLENIRNKVTRKKYQFQLYESILEQIKRSHKRNLDSSMVMIFMAHIYLNKLDNIVKAMKMIKRLENKPSSTSIYYKALIDHFYCKLDKTHAAQDDEQQKGLASSLKEFEAVNLMKRNILEETKRQIAFWEIMKGPYIDVQRVYELGKEIELTSIKIKNQYDKCGFGSSSCGSNKISLASGLIYAVYLKMVRHLPHQGAKLLRRMQTILFSQDFKDDLDLQQQTGSPTMLVISLSKSKIGQVVEVSGPLETVFGFKKRDIIGQKFGILFPKFIAKNLQAFLQKYAYDPKYKLDNKYSLYGRTKDNELFEMEAHLQLFPYLNHKITVMMTLKKTSYQQSIMVADHDGRIVECSESLSKAFEYHSINANNLKHVRDLSPELDQANKAYNLISQQQENEDQDLPSTIRRPINSYEKLDELMTSPRWRNNSVHSKLLIGTNVDWMLSDWNQDGSLTSRSKQCDNMKTLRIQSVTANTMTFSALNKMSLEVAQELYNSFEAGRRIIFSLKSSSSANINIKLLANVRISLLTLCDSSLVYKVIHIPQVYSEQVTMPSLPKTQEQLHPNSPMSPIRILSSEKKIFETESEGPVGTEFPMTETKNSLNHPKIPSTCKFFNFKEQLTTTERTLSPSIKRVTFPSLTKEQETDPPQTESKEFIPSGKNTTPVPEQGDLKEGLRGGIASSIKNSSYKEIRAIEMLNSIGMNKKPHHLHYYFQHLMLIVILLMIILVSINFHFSRKSISEVQDGVNIVAATTWKIAALLQTWQRFLGIPSLVQMGTPETLFVADLWKRILPGDIQTLVRVNNEMKRKIANADEKSELLKDIFEKNIKFWIESETGEKEVEMFDMFTANDVLVSRFLAIKDFSFSDPNLIYVLNNTANDYFLASDRVVTNAGVYLQTTINGNLTRLRAILAVECVILAVLSIVLMTMPMNVMKLYGALFSPLSQIDEGLILAQIEPLRSTQYLLEGEIDAKSFVIDALNIFGDDKSKSIYSIHHPQSKRRNREERVLNFRRLKISLVKNSLFGLCFIPLFAGIFSDTLIQSDKAFQELQTMTEQIVLASKVNSMTLLSLSTLDYERIFYNRTDILLAGASPRIIVYKILAILDEYNKELPGKFLYKSGSDKDLQRIFQDDACSFVSANVLHACLIASQETKMNLLSLGSQYLGIMTYYTNLFNSNPTESHGLEVIIVGSKAASNPSATLQDLYTKIIRELLNDIMDLVDGIDGKVEKNSIVLWVVIVICAIFVKGYTMRKLLEYDVGRRRILRIIPLSIIQNNKALKFYFRRSFLKEVKGAREFLM